MGGREMRDRICHVGTTTSLVPSRSGETIANALLIAAAPDMLAELYAQLDGLEDDIRWADGGELERLTIRRDAVQAVIRKAEGK
jgi:hypothetical protein